jgi:hypothetical protein
MAYATTSATLDASQPTIASLLKANGYETGAAVSSFVLRKETGIAAGFDFYDDYMTHSPLESATSWQRDGDLSRQALNQWLDTTKSTRVFGFLHLYEPHSPYTPPSPYASNPDPYDGEISYADAIVGRFLEDQTARPVRFRGDHHSFRSWRRPRRARRKRARISFTARRFKFRCLSSFLVNNGRDRRSHVAALGDVLFTVKDVVVWTPWRRGECPGGNRAE